MMRSRTPGFTLIELLLVVVLGSIVIAAGFHALVVQQRGYRQQRAVVAAQQTNRLTLSVLAAELREVSAVGGDLMIAEADSVRFRAYRKLAIVCTQDVPGTKRMDVWELGPAIASGDSVVVFAEGNPSSASDDDWRQMRVGSVGSPSCTGDWEGRPLTRLSVPDDEDKLTGIRPGAPVRSFVPMTYGLYQIDGEWMLGRHGPGESPEALVGPLLPPEEGGLRFRYFDDADDELLPSVLTDLLVRATTTRIEITVRGRSPGPGATTGQHYVDSLTTELYLRNY